MAEINIYNVAKRSVGVKKILTIILAILVMMAFFIPRTLADNSDTYQKLLKLPQQMSQTQLKLKAKQLEQATIESQVVAINTKLQQIQTEIKQTDDNMVRIQFEIDDAQWAINQKQKEMDEKKAILKECIQETYEQSKESPLEVLVSSGSFSDLMNQGKYVSVVADKTKQTYDEIEAMKEELGGQQQLLNNKNNELVQLKNKKELSKKTIQAELATKQIILKRIQKEEKNYQQTLFTPEYTAGAVAGKQIICGIASWYGPGFEGGTTASGEPFDPTRLTAAHRTLPFGTLVRVTNLSTGLSCVVIINDRGPYSYQIIDLTRAAADTIGMESVAPVMLEVL